MRMKQRLRSGGAFEAGSAAGDALRGCRAAGSNGYEPAIEPAMRQVQATGKPIVTGPAGVPKFRPAARQQEQGEAMNLKTQLTACKVSEPLVETANRHFQADPASPRKTWPTDSLLHVGISDCQGANPGYRPQAAWLFSGHTNHVTGATQ
ncbi:MAG: hypothetical protein WBP72_13940 [Rhodocyclaceae bacterium]